MSSIVVENASVDFPLLSESARSLKRALVGFARHDRIGVNSHHKMVVRALKQLSFVLKDGDRVGLVGTNGAGKSTLLRMLAGVYYPTSGHCRVEGRIGSLLNLGYGMRDDATGYENIRLGGLLMGIQDDEIKAQTPEIAAFSDLGEHLHLTVGTYSAGMRTRLAFSIATAFSPEIMLIDEVFGTGDASFYRKAESRMNKLVNYSQITVFASHNHKLISELCNKAMFLVDGRIAGFGDSAEIVQQYEETQPTPSSPPTVRKAARL